MIAITLVFSVLFVIFALVLGGVVGWTVRQYMMNYREIPKLHPEFYDENGNVIPDEVVAISFNPDYFDDEEDNDEESDK